MNIYADLWTQARALVILKIIFDLGRPAQLRELVAITQGDDETISKYCSFLATRGLLTRTTSHMGWSLTAQGFAFLRPTVETQDVASLSTGPVNNSPEIPVNSTEKPVNSHEPSIDPIYIRAWNIVRDEIKYDLPAQQFATYFRDCVPLTWESGCLIVSARNTYIRDWLDSRLTSTITRFLVGILNMPAQVRFVTVEKPVNSPESSLSITTILTSKLIDDEVVVEVETGKSGFFTENLRIYEEIGITLNPQTDFIARNIDPAVTRAEWQKLLDKGKPWPGLLIKILTHPPKRTS